MSHNLPSVLKGIKPNNMKRFYHVARSVYWFMVGFVFAAAILSGIVIFYFQLSYKDRVIPGVFVDNIYIGEENEAEIRAFFDAKNDLIHRSTFVLTYQDQNVTISAEELGVGYDTNLIVDQALYLGKSKNFFSNIFIIIESYINGTYLSSSNTFDGEIIKERLSEIDKKIYVEPVDALFSVENGKVTAFQESTNGKSIDFNNLTEQIEQKAKTLLRADSQEIFAINIPIVTTAPEITTEEANDLGIVEKIGEGKSEFKGSIVNRAYNIQLASSRVNGILVPPGEEFSFGKYLGDVSRYTGYKEAYVIQNGRTVLGDGGGVCQVSTTLFRALLNAGLPITERNPHSYRVGYYEQNSPMGLDATVYVPSVDLKFINDTGSYILILSTFDGENQSLSYELYGKRDGRTVEMTEPVVTSRSPAPEPLYQDDPNLPKGVVKQIDYAAPGARVSFNRTVYKDGKVILEDTFKSSYSPWQAVFLVGTKES